MSRRYDALNFNNESPSPVPGFQGPSARPLHRIDFDSHHPHPEPEHASHATMAPGARNTQFNPDIKPTNAANAREYVKDLIEAVQDGRIDPKQHDFTKIDN